MDFIVVLIAFTILDIIYLFGKIFFALTSGMYDNYCFLGFNPKLGDVKIAGVRFSIGIYIPIFPFDRIYKVVDGQKERITMPWQFSQFPIWKRLLVTFGGVITMIIAGIIIFISIAYTNVEKYISKAEANRLGICPSAFGVLAGFQRGDKILLINGKDYEKFEDLIYPKEPARYNILRDGKAIDLAINQEIIDELKKTSGDLFSVDAPFEVSTVLTASRAEEAGLKKGDKITSINGKQITTFFDFKDELAKNKNESTLLTVERHEGKDKKRLVTKVTPDNNGRIGFAPDLLINYTTKENSLIQAVFLGVKNFFLTGYYTIRGSSKIISGEVTHRSGAVSISALGSPWKRLWVITGGWAVAIVILNLLPLPRSCFWQLIPLAYEGIAKKPFPVNHFKTLKRLSYISLASVIILIFANDLIKLFAHL
jgi:regulator of sigma E protease